MLGWPLIYGIAFSTLLSISKTWARAFDGFALPYPIPDSGEGAVTFYIAITVIVVIFVVFKQRESASDARRASPNAQASPRLSGVCKIVVEYAVGILGMFSLMRIGRDVSQRLAPTDQSVFLLAGEPRIWGKQLDYTGEAFLGGLVGAYEELILVAAVALLLSRLGMGATAILAVSVGARILLHFYYGPVSAVLRVALWGTFAAIYFVWTRRWLPLWLAHFYANFAIAIRWDGSRDARFMRWLDLHGEISAIVIGIVILCGALTLVSRAGQQFGHRHECAGRIGATTGRHYYAFIILATPALWILLLRIAQLFGADVAQLLRDSTLHNTGSAQGTFTLWICLLFATTYVLSREYASARSVFRTRYSVQEVAVAVFISGLGYTLLEYGYQAFDAFRVFIAITTFDRSTWGDPGLLPSGDVTIIEALTLAAVISYQGVCMIGLCLFLFRRGTDPRYAIGTCVLLNVLVYSYFDVVGMVIVAGLWAAFAGVASIQTRTIVPLMVAQFGHTYLTLMAPKSSLTIIIMTVSLLALPFIVSKNHDHFVAAAAK